MASALEIANIVKKTDRFELVLISNGKTLRWYGRVESLKALEKKVFIYLEFYFELKKQSSGRFRILKLCSIR